MSEVAGGGSSSVGSTGSAGGASSSAGSSAGSNTNAGATNAPGSVSTGTVSSGGKTQPGSAGGKSNAAPASGAGSQSGAGQAPVDQEFEEIRIGSASHKVPKELAKTLREMQKGMYSAQQRAAAVEKQARGIIQTFVENPREAYKQLGKQPQEVRALFEKILAEEYEHEALSPEQKKLKEYEQKLKDYEERNQREAQTKKQQEYQQTYTNEAKAIQSHFLQAWQDSGLPSDPEYGAFVIMEIQKSIAKGEVADNTPTDRLPWKEAAARVKNAWLGHAKRYAASLAPQALEEFVSPKTLKAWRDFDVNRQTASAATGNQPASNTRPGSSPASAQKKSGLSEDEYREYIERIKQGLK